MDKLQKIIDTCSEQAQELIDFGNSKEHAEGYGMMRVINELINMRKKHILGNDVILKDLFRTWMEDTSEVSKTNLEKLYDPKLVEEMLEFSKNYKPKAFTKEFAEKELEETFTKEFTEENMKEAFYSAREIVLPIQNKFTDLHPLHLTFEDWIKHFKNKQNGRK